MDQYAKFAYSRMSPEAIARHNEHVQRESEAENKAKENFQNILNKSQEIDASDYTSEMIDSETQREKMFALGRYLLSEVKDFTAENKLDLLKKYVEICAPGPEGLSCFFYHDGKDWRSYETFLNNIQNLKDSELKEILDQSPCSSPLLFLKHPDSFSKKNAEKVVKRLIEAQTYRGVDENAPKIKAAYQQRFPDDFDQITKKIDDKDLTFIEAVLTNTSQVYHLTVIKQYIPEYIGMLLPLLLDKGFEKQALQDSLQPTHEQMKKAELIFLKQDQERQQIVDNIFNELNDGKPYAILQYRPHMMAALQEELGFMDNHPELSEFSKKRYFKSHIDILDVGDRRERGILLLNKKAMTKSKEPLTISVAQKYIGNIIGRGGSQIRELTQRYGRRINVVDEAQAPLKQVGRVEYLEKKSNAFNQYTNKNNNTPDAGKVIDEMVNRRLSEKKGKTN